MVLVVHKYFNKYQIFTLFLLALGAVLGSVFRFLIQDIFLANIIGTSVLGFLYGLNISQKMKSIIGLGFCGGITTFSGWILESVNFIMMGQILKAFFSIFCTLIFGILGFYFSYYLGKKLVI